MKNNNNPYLGEDKQLLDIQKRIENELNPEIQLKLKIYTSRLTNNYLNSITQPFYNISNERLNLLEQMEQSQNTEINRKIVQQYYQNFNPSPLYQSLKESLSVSSLADEYSVFIKGLYKMEGINNVVNAHMADSSAFKVFQTGINQICSPMLRHLERHTANLKEYGSYGRQVSEQDRAEKSELRKFRIATAVFAGPIPTLIAKGISSNISDLNSNQERMIELAEKVESGWIEGIEKNLTNFEARLRKRYLFIVYVLFGGLLLKIQEELTRHGYEMTTFDWTTMQGSIGLSQNNVVTVSTWISSSFNKVDVAIKSGNTEDAKLLTEYLYVFLKNKKILSEHEPLPQVTNMKLSLIDMIRNKRLNAHLSHIEGALWRKGQYNDAVDKYLDIITTYEDFEVNYELITNVPEPAVVLARVIAITEANRDNLYAEHLHDYLYKDSKANRLFHLYRNYRYSEIIDTHDSTSLEEVESIYSGILQETGLDNDAFHDYLNNKEGMGPLVDEDALKDGLLDKLYNSKLFGGMTLSDAIRKNNVSRIKYLISKSKGIESRNSELKSPLIVSIEVENHMAFDLIVQKKIDINFKDAQDNTALHHAVKKSNLKMVKTLLNYTEIDLNQQNNKGMTPLMLAVCQNDMDIANKLINAGANPSIKDHEDITPLFASLIRGHLEIAKILFSYTDIDERSNYHGGVTMLMFAAKVNHEEMISLLLEKGANTNVIDHHGKNALTHAIEGGMNVSTMQILGDGGADLDYVNPINGNTPLIEAVLRKNKETAELLVNFGVKLNILNYEGDTALSLAQESHQSDLRDTLINKGAIAI
ncbi:ankyrin repeat domain-containing protein [Salinicoccus luteus]|uniref:ankyrin repeat domain-containing protein n=1 Tax=Salinicoccus luteus TaxID=367840 RepID=UPI0004E0C2D8|nr:ankyrin repeat domain-containing protein [Salinicoccus luteus]